MTGSPRLPWWAAAAGGTVAGYACAAPHRSRAAYRWLVGVPACLAQSRPGFRASRLVSGTVRAI